MSLVWLEGLELMKGRSGVALTQFSSSSSSIVRLSSEQPAQSRQLNSMHALDMFDVGCV